MMRGARWPWGAVVTILGVVAWPAAAQSQVDRPVRPEALLESPSRFEAPQVEGRIHVLSQGVRVVVVEDPTLPLFELAAALPVGEVLDSDSDLGVAAVAAALLRRGGAGQWTARELDERVDHLGLRASSVGGFRRSGVTLSGASRFFDEGLELFAAMLRAPRFEEAAFQKILQQVSAGLGRQDPGARFERLWRQMSYGANGRRARELESVDHLSRDKLEGYHRRCFDPRSVVVAVSGDVDTEVTLAKLQAALGEWRPSGTCEPVEGLALEMVEPGLRLLDERTQQAHVILGHEGVRRAGWDDPDAWGLIVLAEVLAGRGAVSRLSARLREREALVYQVSASLGIGSLDEPLFEVRLSTAPDLVGRVVDAIVGEMRRLRDTEVGALELELAQRSLIDGFPLLFESAEGVAGWFAEDLLLGRPHSYWWIYRDRIASVTPAQVRRLARQHLRPDALRGLILGPEGPIGASLEGSDYARGRWRLAGEADPERGPSPP